jgi:hypothetical protein
LIPYIKETHNYYPTRNKENRFIHQGLQKKNITSTEFICDAVQELSLELQDQNFNLYQVDVKVRTRVQIFEERRTVPGNYYDCAAIDANDLSCEGVEVRNNDHECDPRIDPGTF